MGRLVWFVVGCITGHVASGYLEGLTGSENESEG